MSIDNISHINTKGITDGIYVFDVPSLEDEDANITYLLTMYKDGKSQITRLTDYESLFELIKHYDTEIVKQRSKRYELFIERMALYMDMLRKKEEKTSLTDEDIYVINKQFKSELNKKGNTEILKKIKQLKAGR